MGDAGRGVGRRRRRRCGTASGRGQAADGGSLACLAATVLRGRREQFAFGALLAGVATLAGLHAANPDALIVRVNAARIAHGQTFDAAYAASLSGDAVPGRGCGGGARGGAARRLSTGGSGGDGGGAGVHDHAGGGGNGGRDGEDRAYATGAEMKPIRSASTPRTVHQGEAAMELHIRDVSKTYPNGVQALKDVTLTIPAGMYGLLGPNGAGKSTLMRILATLQEPDRGSIRLGDTDVLRHKDAVRRSLGYLPQEFGVYPKVSAERLLDHFALLKGIAERGARREVVEALLRQTNLWEVRRQKLGGYSGGMRQRFGVAVALLGNPKLVIVDEPTAGLDPAERVRFLNLLSEVGENSVVILSTHIVEDVSELCTRMAIIDRGEILLEAEPLGAIAEMRGRIWRSVIDRGALAALEREHAVISTRLLAGRTVVHVHSDTTPGPGFEPAEPDLEDVYFSAMAGRIGRRREQPQPAVAS